jgi:hypothetical protein
MLRWIAPLLLVPTLAVAAPPVPGAEAVSLQRVSANVEYLASDALQGRGSGAEGGRKAGDWLADRLRAIGAAPGGVNGSYFQPFSGQGQEMRNVIATIPGTEPGEMVIVGAHYDHLGMGHQMGSLEFGRGKGKVHNGADDNASGTAAVLEVARAFIASGRQPRRRVVFIFFDGEERGLLGSNHFVANPTVADKAVLVVNLDMVGKLRDRPLGIWGATTGGQDLQRWIHTAAEGLDMKLNLKDSVSNASDHAPFYKAKVPVCVPFTGLHKDYHRSTDDVEGLDMAGIVKVAQLSYGITAQAADADSAPGFVQAKDGTMEVMMEQMKAMFGGGEGGPDLSKLFGGGGEGGPDLSKLFGGDGEGLDGLAERLRELMGGGGRERRTAPAAGRRPRLGVSLEQGNPPVVTKVHEGTLAERIGLQEGDRIERFDQQPVDSVATLQRLVRAAKGRVALQVGRGEGSLEVVADFGGEVESATPQPKPAPTPAVPSGPRWF